MRIQISALVLGAVAASAIALPAQAATVKTTTTNVGGDLGGPAAYRIEGLNVGGTNYDVNFDYGSFYGLYGNPPAPSSYAGAFADQLGAAILGALGSVPVTKLVAANVTGFGTNVLTEFFIPKSEIGQNPNQDTFLQCFTSSGTCPIQNRDPAQNDSVLFARFAPAAVTGGGGGGGAAIPTPALLPGLIGMGWTAMRKKRQTAAE
jgi:hypothetical protein